MIHLSDDWYPCKESRSFPVQTTMVAAALHTLRQHQTRMRASRAESCQGCQQRETTKILSQGAPVRWLSCTSRKLRDPSIDHEGDSCPARRQAALTIGMPMLTDLRAVQDISTDKTTCRLNGRTCQRVGMHVKAAQASQRGPRRWQRPCTPCGSTQGCNICMQS